MSAQDIFGKNANLIITIVLAGVGWAVSWGMMRSDMNTMQTRLQLIESNQQKKDDRINAIDRNVIEIKTDLKYLRQSIESNEND